MYEITEGIWGVDGDVYMGMRLHFPVRMLVFRLEDGGLLLHSPVALDDETEAALRSLGEVRYVIAPSLMHHLFVKKALQRFPEAVLYGAPGFAEKRPDLPFAGYLEEGKEYPWSGTLSHVMTKGVPVMNEVVFYHGATRSLVVTDLVFHLARGRNLQTDLMYRLAGVRGKLAQSRLIRLMTKDKEALRESMEVMLQWQPERLVMAHGEIFQGDVNAALRKALGWLDLSPQLSEAGQEQRARP